MNAATPLRSRRRPDRPRRAARPQLRLVGAAVALGLLLAGLPAAPGAAAPSPTAPGDGARGDWAVRGLGGGRWDVRWTSPTRFPVTADRPTIVRADGGPVGTPTVADDGRTVRAVVTAATAPDPDDLDVVLSGARLDAANPAAARRSRAADVPAPGSAPDPGVAARRLAADPGVPGPHRVQSSDYTLTPVKLAGMAQPIEMVGHVVEPAAGAVTGPRPLVLFLHGRHEYCYRVGAGQPNDAWPCRGTMREIPSHLGYDYAQRLLASQGVTTVSVRVNGINAQDYALDDGGADARATVIARHLDHWTGIAARHRVDLDQVVLVGHSRGGEGANRASLRIPLSAPYRVVGQVLLAPTDFGTQTAPYVPTVTVLPYCDGDVYDLQGQRFTDTGRDLTDDDRSLKSSVLVMGANHNFFNTEWTPGIAQAPASDDWFGEPTAPCGTRSAGRLTAAQQRAVGQAYVAGAVHQFTAAASAPSAYLPLFDGSRVSLGSTGPAVALSHALGAGRDVRRPARDTTLTLATGASSRFCDGATSDDYRPDLCGSELAGVVAPHWPSRDEQVPTRTFWQLGWTARGQSAGLQLDRPLDLRDRDLDLRAVLDPRLGDVALRVRLTDASGGSTTLEPVGGTTVRRLLTGPDVTKLWAQPVRVDPRPAASRFDLARVVRVEVVGDSPDGRLWVADVAAAPRQAPGLDARRVPTVSLGDLRVTEGDRPGTSVAAVPFRLSAPMTKAGSFQVLTASDQADSLRRFTIDLAVGQRSGTIPVGYQADDLDSPDESLTFVVAHATRNVMTDDYLGQLVVVDDDPTPKVTISRAKTTVAEGMSAQWKVTFAGPVGYDAFVDGEVVRGPGRDLLGTDVPKTWLAEHQTRDGKATETLAALGVTVYGSIPIGERTVTLSVPARRDGVKEGTEAVTLRITALGTTRTSTIKVTNAG